MRLAVLLLALLAAPALAHHGWGSYDPGKALTIESTIRSASLANPHSTMTVPHEGRALKVVLAPLSRMQARGATAGLVAPGKRVRSLAYRHRSRAGEARAEWIEVDGRRIALRK